VQAGYEVQEVEPPSVEGVSELCWRLVWTETRCVLAPMIRKLGDAQANRALDVYLASAPETDLAGYIRDIAQRAKHLRDWMAFLEHYPLVVGPVSTEPPLPVGFDINDSADGEKLRRIQRLLITVNLLGLPAAAVPTGVSCGAPIGVQIIGSRYREDMCLDAAEAIESQCGLNTPIDVQW
jgi:amidase